jgi:maltose O-acetyltransferase
VDNCLWQKRSIGVRMLHKFLVVSYELLFRCIFCLPRYRLFDAMKAWFLIANGAVIGRNPTFYPGVWIMPGRGLVVGDDVDFALGVIVTTGGGVTIGDRTLIGYRSQILSMNHRVPEGGGEIFSAGHVGMPVRIGQDVWIGSNAIILPGVTVGDGAVIGAGSIVTKSVEAYCIVAGNPAGIVRYRERRKD